jgi:DNA-binding CsgD family transcriptional regulator
MAPADDLLRVTDRLYAAAAGSEPWTFAIQSVVDLMQAHHAALDVHGEGPFGTSYAAMAGLDEGKLASIVESGAMETALPLIMRVPTGISARAQLISDAEFLRSAAYNEVIRPLNGFHSVSIRRIAVRESYLFTVCRPQSCADFGPMERTALQALMPHIDTVVSLHNRLQRAEQGRGALTRTLDRLGSGVILTDASGRPVFINASASRIALESDGLILDDGGIAGATPALTRRLREAIAVASMDAAVESQHVCLDRPSQRLPLLLTIFPVWRLGLSVAGTAAPRVAIFLSEPDAPQPLDRTAIADAFRLTRRESDIAMLLSDGLDLATIASRLGLGIGTVRDHLKHVFEKTGTRSQVALVALLRGFVGRAN